jgi:SAM-dependent methyltransferase
VRRAKLKNLLGISNKLDNLLSMGKTPHFPWMCPGLIDLDSKILDVGCGSGFLLEEMAAYGLKGLYGIDLFANISVQAHSNIHFKQCSLSDYELTEFDLVMFHHSFEHFADPIETLCAARDRLADRGTILIRIPVADSDAFEKYRENWVHLDAPRHYFVPTQKSVEILADSCHLKLVGHYRDSNGFGIVGSECYLRGLPLGEESSLFSAKELAAFQAEAEYLNYENRGDSACFYLKRSET